jgi:hypothetical protein
VEQQAHRMHSYRPSSLARSSRDCRYSRSSLQRQQNGNEILGMAWPLRFQEGSHSVAVLVGYHVCGSISVTPTGGST